MSVAIALILVLVGLLIMKWAHDGQMKAPPEAKSPYRGVAIKPSNGGCGAVQRWLGKRLLSREAPALPVPGCGSPHCQCTFQHFDDRRAGERRHSGTSARESGGEKWAERRCTRGRRKTDHRRVLDEFEIRQAIAAKRQRRAESRNHAPQ